MLFIVGCGRATAGRDKRLAGYIESFEAYSGIVFNGTVEIVNLNLGEHTIDGMCRLEVNPLTKQLEINTRTSRIQIDLETYTKKSTEKNGSFYIEQVLMHEFLHCTKNKPHDANLTQSQYNYSMPESVMYPYSFGDTFAYRNNRDYYFKELLK